MSDVAEVKEALERWDAIPSDMTEEDQPWYPLVDAARRWVRLAEGLDYEAAAKAIYDYGLPTATHDKQGRRVPFDKAMMTDSFRQAARASLDAAVGVEKETESYRKLDPAWDGSQPYRGV